MAKRKKKRKGKVSVARVKKLARQGLTGYKIAKRMHKYPSQIYPLLRKHKIKAKKGKLKKKKRLGKKRRRMRVPRGLSIPLTMRIKNGVDIKLPRGFARRAKKRSVRGRRVLPVSKIRQMHFEQGLTGYQIARKLHLYPAQVYAVLGKRKPSMRALGPVFAEAPPRRGLPLRRRRSQSGRFLPPID